jgi:hypothetical protein
MLIEAMATHKALVKNFFESNLREKDNIFLLDTYDFGSKCDK